MLQLKSIDVMLSPELANINYIRHNLTQINKNGIVSNIDKKGTIKKHMEITKVISVQRYKWGVTPELEWRKYIGLRHVGAEIIGLKKKQRYTVIIRISAGI